MNKTQRKLKATSNPGMVKTLYLERMYGVESRRQVIVGLSEIYLFKRMVLNIISEQQRQERSNNRYMSSCK